MCPPRFPRSLFLNVALRLHPLDPAGGGAVTIDGNDIRRVRGRSLRAAVGVLPAAPVLIRASIHDNVRYAKWDADAGLVFAALINAGLGDGSDAVEPGVTSAGLRLRIGMARLLFRAAPINIVDDGLVKPSSTDLIFFWGGGVERVCVRVRWGEKRRGGG